MDNINTIPMLIDYFVSKYKNKLLFQRRDGWSWKQLTWVDFDSDIKNLSSFLLSLDFGCGQHAVVVSSNNNECAFSELAIYCLGGSVIPFSNIESLLKYRDSVISIKPEYLFLENSRYLDEIKKDALLYGQFRKIIVFHDSKIGVDEKVIPYKALLKFGQLKKKEFIDIVKRHSKGINPSQNALKLISQNGNIRHAGSEINHGKIMEILKSVHKRLGFITREDQSFSLLVSSSLFDKLAVLIGISLGIRMVIAESLDSFYADILEVKPTVLFENAKGLENIYNRFTHSNKSNDIKAYLGGRLKCLITDSAADKQIDDEFRSSGIEIIELPEFREFS